MPAGATLFTTFKYVLEFIEQCLIIVFSIYPLIRNVKKIVSCVLWYSTWVLIAGISQDA